jgi:hypothetical protein
VFVSKKKENNGAFTRCLLGSFLVEEGFDSFLLRRFNVLSLQVKYCYAFSVGSIA